MDSTKTLFQLPPIRLLYSTKTLLQLPPIRLLYIPSSYAMMFVYLLQFNYAIMLHYWLYAGLLLVYEMPITVQLLLLRDLLLLMQNVVWLCFKNYHMYCTDGTGRVSLTKKSYELWWRTQIDPRTVNMKWKEPTVVCVQYSYCTVVKNKPTPIFVAWGLIITGRKKRS